MERSFNEEFEMKDEYVNEVLAKRKSVGMERNGCI